MKSIKDKDLIAEIQRRLDERNSSLAEMKKMMCDLKEVNNKLKKSEKSKSQFLSNIRNEINNPLSSIIAFTESQLNSNDFNNAKKNKEISKLIHSEACELEFQLVNIFVASELEAGKLLPDISRCHLSVMINDVIENVQYRKICNSKKILLKNCIPESTVFMTDAEKTALVLTNLLSNSAKFSKDGKDIVLDVSLKNNMLNIQVIDHGDGICKKDQKRIFDRFIQLDTGITKAHKGHGLGLSISKALLDLLGGSIEVESHECSGSTFSITIPEGKILNDDEVSFAGNEEFFTNETESEGIELF